MSRLVDRSEYDDNFELEERISFLYEGTRLTGVVARVYNTREWYHVEVAGRRYSVNARDDEMQRE